MNMAMPWLLLISGALVVNWALSLAIVLFWSPQPQPLPSPRDAEDAKRKKNVLLVVAHPDDESMFFAPSLLSLADLGCYNVRILCISNGNAEGLGSIRTKEMISACSVLNVPRENIEILDHPSLQDGHKNVWSQVLVSEILHRAISTNDIDTILTFDSYGVSGHPNHIAVYRGVCAYLIGRAKHSESQNSKHVDAWKLESMNIAEKYAGPMGVLRGFTKGANTHYFYNRQPSKTVTAMKQHASQWLWFRRFFVVLSHYSYINRLQRIVL